MTTEAQTFKRKEKQAAVSKARADSAIAAADAILIPLGFVRYVAKNPHYQFNEWGPAKWFLKAPGTMASLRLQSKPWTSRSSDPLVYRLELSADNACGVKRPRVAPGNRQAVVDYLAKVESAKLPRGAEVLDVQVQAQQIAMWVKLDNCAEEIDKRFALVGTCHPLREAETWAYKGTVQTGQFVWHLFQEPS